MPQNPFTVVPGGDYGPGLRGLSDTIGQIGERKRKEEAEQKAIEKFATMKAGAMEAYRSGDPDTIAEFSLANPEMSQALSQSMGFKSKQTEQNYQDSLFDFYQNPTEENVNDLVESRQELLRGQGVGPDGSQETDQFMQRYAQDPEGTHKEIGAELAFRYPKKWKSMQGDKKEVDPYEGLTADYETYLRAHKLENTPETYEKFNKIKETSNAVYSPSPLKKMMDERQALLDSGMSEDHKYVQAYDAKISGVDINIEDMTQSEIDYYGAILNTTGKMPSFGRGKQATKIKQAVAKSAARQSLGADENGVPDIPGKTPVEAAMDTVLKQADTKAIQGSLNFLDKQLSSMGSFVTNLNSQVDKVGELAKDLKTFDTRILNIPLRAVRGRIKGSPLQAKYDMYLSEIESEIGKLATGSTGSVAELSASAQEKWSKIHDKNMSVSDMLSLLDETKAAANFRLDSVQGQLDKTRARMKREGTLPPKEEPSAQYTEGQTASGPEGPIIFRNGNWEAL